MSDVVYRAEGRIVCHDQIANAAITVAISALIARMTARSAEKSVPWPKQAQLK